MDPARFARLKEILLTLERLPPGERDGHVENSCGHDAELAREVRALLSQGSRTFDFWEAGGLKAVVESLDIRSTPPPIPARIGPYEILGVLGEGGMGVVFRARQTTPVRRDVALKLIRGGALSASVVERFEAERQALAAMNHPGIAQMFEAGTDEAGNPFFAMELVSGMPITDFCRSARLNLRERLELFRTVCGAVLHAHRKGVLHRDLKPSNILVTQLEGQLAPKIIDFGVAKILEEGTVGPGLTREGHLVGTLEYMSPEQALGGGRNADMRSDVYSLGIVLYELVTDELPYELKGLSLTEALQVIAEAPPRPLRQTRAGARGDHDLQTVLFKALEKDPDRRYGSVAELSEDVGRYLRSEPILAHPPSRTYLLRKLARRHRTASATLAVSLLLLVAFGAVSAVMLGVQTRERKRAEREASKATQTLEFMQEVLLASVPDRGGQEVTVRKVVDESAKRLDEDPPDQPEVEVAVRRSLATTYLSLSQYAGAEEQLKRALAACDRDPANPPLEKSQVLHDLAVAIYYQGVRYAEAESLTMEALRIRKAVLGEDEDVAALMNNVAMIRSVEGDDQEVEHMLREAYEVSRRVTKKGEEFPVIRIANLATFVERLGRLREAELLYRENVDRSREALKRTGDPTHDWRLAFAEAKLGAFLCRMGRYDAAESLTVIGIESLDRVFGTDYNDAIPLAWWHLAQIHHCRGDYVKAESLFTVAEAKWKQAPIPSPDRTVLALNGIGLAQAAQERLIEAARTQAAGVALAESTGNSASLALALRGQADCYHRAGRPQEAEDLLRKAVIHQEGMKKRESAAFASTLLELGMLLIDSERHREAIPILRRSIQEQSRGELPQHWLALVSGNELAAALSLSDSALSEADSLWSVTREILLSKSSPVPSDIRQRALKHTVRALERSGDSGQARLYADERGTAARVDPSRN